MSQPLLSVQTSTVMDSRERRTTLSHLPIFRFTTITIFLVAIDSLFSISLWIAGGNSAYLENSVEDFSIYRSTFDLACLAAVRGVILVACLYYLEHHTLVSVSSGRTGQQATSRKLAWLCHAVILILSLSSLIYAAIKLGLIIYKWSDVAKDLHITYKILCIAGVVTPLVELVLGCVSFYFMWRLIHMFRLRLILNENGTDEAKSKADLKRLALLAVPEYPILFIGIIMLCLSSAAQAVSPYFFGAIIDAAIRNESLCDDIHRGVVNASLSKGHCTLWPMNKYILYLVGVFVLACVAAMLRSYCFNVSGERFVARLRRNLFSAIIRQEMGFFDTNRTGELTNRLASDTAVIQGAVTENVSILARYLLQTLISVGIMFWISAKLTAVLLAVLPIIIIGAVQYGRYMKKVRKEYQDKLALANSTAEEAISNLRTVRAFSNERKMTSLYDIDINSSYRLGKILSVLSAMFTGVVFPLIYGASCLILWYGGYLVFHGQLSPGKLTSLMLYTLTLAMCFAFISFVYGEFMQAVGASVRIFELLDRISQVVDGNLSTNNFKGEIVFQDVEFTYPSRPDEPVLKGVSFQVNPGQMVALVGPSGGGKTTIVNLIEHFYEILSGRILIGGMDVRDLDPQWFRKRIGIVNQEPVLFACSIRDNIAFGKEDATLEEIEEVARQANAHDFISSFEERYDTMVGERGVRLSGGQKQRVAIARALLLNPDILLLDEATSALDAESEHLVQEAIDRAMKGRTVLVIAHRLSTVRDASIVMVIEKGCIVEQGTHDELIALGGVYKRLVLRQLMSGEENGGSSIEGDSAIDISPKIN